MNEIDKGRLHTETKELLDRRPRTVTLQSIADKTGLTLSWLSSFSSGINHPSVDRVERLNDYLKGVK